ncbi:LLM class flavin-dependent oxidoreductase [Pseudonocardia sp. RS010]|uniref:LLM class flavin-dependent oxidoreductase n=1 Tax=Pseudonocardia sp. RS010 TaxID=3385979 RepID=UPI0039A07FB3
MAGSYLRHSYVLAKGAELVADDTGGRLVLGLGVSHRPVNGALGIAMDDPAGDLVRYTAELRDWFAGKGPTTHLPQPAPVAVPLHHATLGMRAAGTADGIMPTMWSPERLTGSSQRPATARRAVRAKVEGWC